MKFIASVSVLAFTTFVGFTLQPGTTFANDDTTSLVEAFKQGTVKGQLKSYYYAQTFDGDGLNDSQIWVNGGILTYKTAGFYGFRLGGTFQASVVGHKNDDDGKTAGSMDADGAVLSEAYLSYTFLNTKFDGGRQFVSTPLVAGSGSRLIKESFEAYLLSNEDIPDTVLTAGWIRKYQTRTDKSSYGDNWFVDYDQNGSGDPGDFYDVGDDGMLIFYARNSSVKNLQVQAQYGNVLDQVAGFYADAKYTIDVQFKPYVAGQIYYTDYDDSTKDSNSLYGFKGGVNIADFEIFAAFTSAAGDEGEARVFRGLGQGAYYNYTSTTKTAGAPAFEAGTDSYQIGGSYKFEKLATMLRYTVFDNPADNQDLDEYTLNASYALSGWAEGFGIAVDFSILDYENNQKDATDLRTRLTYTF